MSTEIFNAGDEVYFPFGDNGLHILTTRQSPMYPLELSLRDIDFSFDTSGKINTEDGNKSIFKATLENKKLLEALYGSEFDSPTLKGLKPTNSNSIENRPLLKAYEMDDEGTIYAGESFDEVIKSYLDDFGTMEHNVDYPRELTDSELDLDIEDRDENEMPTGEITSIRKWLNQKTVAGFLCGGVN